MNTPTKEDLNELAENTVNYIRGDLAEIGGKLRQTDYDAIALLLYAFLTVYVKPV